MSDAHLFDRQAVVRNRLRSRSLTPQGSFLFREIGNRLADRLLDVRRDFPLALDLSGHRGLETLLADAGVIEARRIETIITAVEST